MPLGASVGLHMARIQCASIVNAPLSQFLGFGWESDMKDWRPEFLWQVGEPQGPCVESPAGIFTRPWTYGDAVVNCNSWTAVVPVAN